MAERRSPGRWPRRRFLTVAGATALGAAAATAGGGTAAATTTGRTGTTGTAGTHQPVESGWTPKRPRLTTPWTRDVSPANARPEYPRPQLRRPRWASLNGVWQFAALAAGAQARPGEPLAERILVPYPVESALSGIMRHEPRMAYRRGFVVPDAWDVGGRDGQRLLLHLDAVDHEATVVVNGHRLATHRGGYDRFSVDVTAALRTDRRSGRPAGVQELIVEVADPTEDGVQPLGKQRVAALDPAAPHSALYYTPCSGIWQPVWMEPVPRSHATAVVVAADLAAGLAHVTVEGTGGSGAAVRVTVAARGRRIGSATGRLGEPLAVRVPHPRPWTPDDPFRYDLRVEVLDGHASGRVDRVGAYLAMREVGVETIGGTPHLTLNGAFVAQVSCLQQGYWPDGLYTAATDDALRFDLEQAKRLGFTTVRKHQKVEPDRWYHLADTLGVLVWQDMPATATGRQPPHQKEPSTPPAAGQVQFEAELDRVVRQLRAFPSVVMWIPFNEGWGAYDLARIGERVRRLDPTRIVNDMSGTTTADYDEGGGDVLDWHNLGTHEPGPVPPTGDGRAAVIGEFGAFAYVVPGHEWYPGHSVPNQSVPGAHGLTEAYVTAMDEVAGFVRDQGLSAANYNLFEDAELQVNGLFTYDRQVFKADSARRVRAANLRVRAAAKEVGR